MLLEDEKEKVRELEQYGKELKSNLELSLHMKAQFKQAYEQISEKLNE